MVFAIDTDVSDIDLLFEELGKAYGWDKVARINNNCTFTPRAVTRKILNIFDNSERTIKKITGLLPNDPFLTWQDCLNNKEYIRAMESFEKEWKAIQRIQGSISHFSKHAGGIIIWDKLSDVLPCRIEANLAGERVKRVVEWDMDALHELDHVKFDFLGLATLETLKMMFNDVKTVHDIDIDMDTLDYEDKEVYKLICSGDMSGIFQLAEQAGVILEQQPNNFKQLIASTAIIRPGDITDYLEKKKGIQKWSVHPLQEPYLAHTFGEYVFQEQYLLDAYTFAGWTIGYADKHLRKNKEIRKDEKTKEKFISDCISRKTLDKEEATKLWETIVDAVTRGLIASSR